MDAQFPSNFPGGGDTMKINTKESIIVRPIQEIPQQRLWVSNMDLLHPRYYLPTVYLYKPNGSSDFFEAEVLKEALRKRFIPRSPFMHKHWLSNMDAQFPSNFPGGGHTMKINTKESIIVRPIQEMPQRRLWLSNMDLLNPIRFYVLTVYLYKPNGSSDFFEAEVLKEALRKVLVPFYPAAGRLARDENGRIEINCNGEGVLLVVADTDSTTEELGEFMPSMKLQQLIPTVDTNLEDISRDPLVLLQVTSFKCGGVCLGVGWHHTLADGTGALHFMNSWATLARGLSITIPPLCQKIT
ncbi:SHIKIMATE O-HYDROXYCINNAMOYLTRANSFERASE-LIKE [Salix purpurea]|uniref:SHIKIMATE O-HYDROXYCINNAMOYLTRANSFERASE-LIKE n=1 Tax=Salix purpurea TaxID=77065 RepID=A0A9Q0V958_SALPP|nr:SHIKIMATE O-HYDROXYCINNAMOYLTRANSFERASE-LIKE [Salix purpurea]